MNMHLAKTHTAVRPRTGRSQRWKKLAALGIAAALVTTPTVVHAVTEGNVGSTSSTMFDPTGVGGFRYGPSMILNADNSIDAWTCSPGSGIASDYIRHAKSTDGGASWSPWTIAYQPTVGQRDQKAACDPGVFIYDGYYYMGYTSLDNDWGANDVFIARSTSTTGPWQKWNGTSWGTSSPQPLIEYTAAALDTYGAGEPSFVVRGTTLYIYYTWDSRNPTTGEPVIETRVSTADLSDPDWASHTTYQGVAIERTYGEDSTDHKWVPTLNKYIAVGVAKRFTNDSYLKMWESTDGITYRPANLPDTYAKVWAHNAGLTGDGLGHFDTSKPNKVAYAHGTVWGYWYNAIQSFSLSSTSLPARPILDHALAGNGSVTLNYRTSGVAGETYTIKYGTTSGSYTSSITGVTGGTRTITGLTNGQTYFFSVEAVQSSGASGNSNQLSATPLAYADAPRLSATARSSAGTGWSAANAIDGSLSSVYSSVGHTVSSANEWISVDTGANRMVKRVTLTPRQGMLSFPVDPVIEVSADNVTWVKADIETSTRLMKGPYRYVYEFDQALSGRYVRASVDKLSHDDSTPWVFYLQLADFKIESVPGSAVVSSSLSGWDAHRILDGAANSVWSSVARPSPTAVEWVGMDLGSPQRVSGVLVRPRSGGAAFPQSFRFQSSSDGATWTDIPGASYTAFANPGSEVQTFTFGSAITTRYVRLYATELGTEGTGFYLQIADMWPDRNERRVASVSSAISDPYWDASHLVDSQKSTSWSSLGHTSAASTEWATVDMGSVQNWSRIQLATTKDQAFPVDFTVQSSVNGTTWSTIPGLAIDDFSYFPGESTANPRTGTQAFTFGALVNARYFRVHATQLRPDSYGNHYLQIGEIIVDR